MADKAAIAKKIGIALVVKKVVGKVIKLAVVAGIGAAVLKVLRGQER